MSAGAAVAAAARPPERVRVVTAASLFDGHDAAINIMRRLLQAQGAEVIHLGHDRSVEEVVEAAVQEDAHAVAVSSYQGGHMEYFRYLVERLREAGAGNVRVYGGGGGTITPAEAEALHAFGVARIFLPEDGRRLGLAGMIRSLLAECAQRTLEVVTNEVECLSAGDPLSVARLISWFEEMPDAAAAAAVRRDLDGRRRRPPAPVVGFTGTGGSGKSSVLDELVRRFRLDFPDRTLALLLVDPSRRRSGGALLGDRLRMNAIHGPGVFVRSLATRQANLALSRTLGDALRILQAADFDLILVETAGIGQSDSEIVDLADVSVYVMTPDYGAASQLEKIDMLDLADFTVLNKFDRQGAEDALRDVRKQWRRNRGDFERADAEVPVFPTIACQWDDAGSGRFYAALRRRLFEEAGAGEGELETAPVRGDSLIPPARRRYLAEIAETVRGWRQETEVRAERAGAAFAITRALREIGAPVADAAQPSGGSETAADSGDPAVAILRDRYAAALAVLGDEEREQLDAWPETRARYAAEEQSYRVRGREVRVANRAETLARTRLAKVALPRTDEWGALVRYFRLENLPGRFPFTAGVFPFKREAEDPTRMFAGEGGPERTNRRFHYLCRGQPAARLSTAFDSVTLYGRDPDPQPDVYGKVGNSGVSVCTVDDAKKLYSGFDLGSPTTSVSMTINGPAPTVLAFFMNAAIDQGVEKHLRETGRLERARKGRELPVYAGERPEGHDGLGLGLLGIAGDEVVDAETYARIRSDVLRRVRGTVQADILKEDQAQNTCIFSTDFSLQVMGDIQAWFIENAVRNFYSVSISGYHMAEAGANPITQLAFTLANGFTLCEYYAARGMAIDAFAPNFSFFFSNGLDAEYSVIGRVARRIWAVALRERYGASERSQKLKYHIQTSGRSLHAQEMAFNDIRTTLQALLALQDRCDSLHTNAYDEAVTTPTEASVRRALAIQLIINREFGMANIENPLQGSYGIEQLTDAVEEAVLREFERLSARGGVLGAMETGYQRGRIQDESLRYESLKDSGELPIIGVNTFENPNPEEAPQARELMRSSDDEKRAQLANLRAFYARHAARAPDALLRLQRAARSRENVFAELMETVKVASLGQISSALFEVGGRYRRAM
ncbi:MAG: methylmalonyl-CoA mutase family protein [Myxococcales bacterium]|nr:methylmalonyl-CoA mutase family protein [Myxococcales bacterium]